MKKLLEVKNLKKYFNLSYTGFLRKNPVILKAVNNVSFDINKGETLGLVGESGCGKSTLARTILRLHEPTAGEIIFEGNRIDGIPHRELDAKRKDFQMIFQDPYASLNPRMTIGDIIAEPLIVFKNHKIITSTKNEIRERVKYLLNVVGLSQNQINRYPHEFSGGQRQRIGIARALALQPKLILCDEPVSALDVSIQAQILNLLQELQKEFALTYLFISHDLSVVRHISDRVAVMYLGKILEIATFNEIYDNPLHPYTKALLSAVPIPDPEKERKRKRIIITGDITSAYNKYMEGCLFCGRCPDYEPACDDSDCELKEINKDHWVACKKKDVGLNE